jgi:hypothetical protein
VLLQWRGNGFVAEFGDNADEPAHFVTGLMVRDYVAQGFPGSPVAYARNYYVHYPKVSLGHWPPVFYLVQAAWTLIIPPGHISLMLLMAAITALLATAVQRAVGTQFSSGWALGAGAFWLSLPAIEVFSRDIMAEMLVALIVFLAVLAYGRYLDTERWQPAAWFGVLVALGLLTKGTAIQLAVVPPVAILLRGRLDLLRRVSFWIPAILVGAIAGPWYLWVPGAQHESVARFGGAAIHPQRLTDTLLVWFHMLGVVAAVAAVAGLYLSWKSIRTGEGKWAAGLAVVLGAYLSRLLIGAFEDRHLIANLSVLILFGVVAAERVLRRREWVGVMASLTLIGFNVYSSPVKPYFGYSGVARRILAHPEFDNSVILTCSNAGGEGMLISEIAMRESRPGHYILRATKMLASSDWMGWDYKPLYADSNALLSSLEAVPVGIVVIDEAGRRTPHGRMLYEGLQAFPAKWVRIESGPIEVYRLAGHEGKPINKIEIPMRSTLYGTFSN